MTAHPRLLPALSLLYAIVITACTGTSAPDTWDTPGDTLTTHARYLTLVDRGHGIITADVADPWTPGHTMARYALLDSTAAGQRVPPGYTIVHTPVTRAVLFENTYAGIFGELDARQNIAAVADKKFFTQDYIHAPRIKDIGNNMSPSIETLVQVMPDAVLRSPYQNSGQDALARMGITTVWTVDYMEPTPLGRAEWMLLAGALTGRTDRARHIYSRVRQEYTPRPNPAGPTVLCETPASGVWYQPGGASYMAAMIRDAGALPLLDGDNTTGSVQLDLETALDKASHATLWITKQQPAQVHETLAGTMARRIPAATMGQVYNAHPERSGYFADIAFHPERILHDLQTIVANPANPGTLRYFTQIRQTTAP